jgi:putative transposase
MPKETDPAVKKRPDKDRAYQTGLFRYGLIADLLARPPELGELAGRLRAIAEASHIQPWDGEQATVVVRTLERWLQIARASERPAEALQPKIRSDVGLVRAVLAEHRAFLADYRLKEPSWSVRLLFDNLAAQYPNGAPSYSSVLRYMRSAGLLVAVPGRRRKRHMREVRSFEVGFVGELWHMDFHKGSRSVVTRTGEYVQPICVAFIDDHSRLACHVQWYLQETAEVLVHAFIQAVLKRGLPRGFYTDCGSAMRAEEFEKGLEVLSVTQKRTLPYSPYQNGKQEAFWQPLEGRLMKMLPKGKTLSLENLNRFTQAWVEQEYQVTLHSETKAKPIDRFLKNTSVLRTSPAYDDLRRAFRMRVTRKQRQTDGTVTLDGVRFEIPSAYRHLKDLTLRYARWDLSEAEIIDPKTYCSLTLIRPLDKLANASGIRKPHHESEADSPAASEQEILSDSKSNEPLEIDDSNLPPLLARLLRQQEQDFRAPGYIPLLQQHGEK